MKTDQFAELRAAIDAVPYVKWTASRSTVHIPETDDWAGKDLSITGLDKQVARKLARYIADTHPVAIRALLAERDALREALANLVRGYVYTLEGGRDRIVSLGGQCDPVDVMEADDPYLRAARAALAQEQGGAMTAKTDDWTRVAAEAAEEAKAQRAANPAHRNAEQIVDTPHGVAFVTLDPVPCRHEFDQDSEACTLCGMSIWSHAFRECP